MTQKEREHKIKCWPEFFEPIAKNIKRAEFRLDDRDYKEGDILIIQEWSPKNCRYSGRKVKRLITHKVTGKYFGIPEGYCMLSIKPYKELNNDTER